MKDPRPGNQPAAKPASRSGRDRWTLALLGLALIAATALYAPTLPGGFLADDYWYLDQAQTVHFTEHPFLAARKGNFYYFRPLPSLLWSALYPLLDGRAPLYRTSSLLLHLLTTAAVLALARRALKSGPAAGLAALAFAVHPLHAEAVAWVSSNSDLLAALFFALALERYLAFRESGGEEARARAWPVVAFGLLAMLCKESAYILPAAALAAEVLPGANRPRRQRAMVILVLAAAAGSLFLVRAVLALGQLRPPTGATPPAWFLGNLGLSLVRFAGPAARSSLAQAVNFAFMGLLAAGLVRLIVMRGAARALYFGLLVLLLALVPPALVGRVGLRLEFSRTLYLPSIGFVIFLAALLAAPASAARSRSRLGRAAAPVLAGLVIGLLFLAAAMNLKPWVQAGEASRALERALVDAGKEFQPGQSARVEGVPITIRGVPFHSNSYTLSIAASLARFPEEFKRRGFEDRNSLPFYAVSAQAPAIEAKMILIKRLRELKTGSLEDFNYLMKWDSPWAVKEGE